MKSAQKKLYRSLIILLCLIVVSCQGTVSWVQAQEQQEQEDETGIQDVLSFHMLGFEETELRGPIALKDYYFGVPGDWLIQDGAEVSLALSVFYNSSSGFTFESGMYVGSIEVQYNEKTIGTVALTWSGDRTVTVPISPDALVSPYPSGRHVLSLRLRAMLDCERGFDVQTLVAVRDTSFIHLPHTATSPDTDLSRLPYPIFQQSFLPDNAILVIPDEPTVGEMRAILVVAAGLGRMTYRQLGFSLVTERELTDEMRQESHIVLVGKPSTLGLLNDPDLQLPIEQARFTDAEMQPDDGMLDMLVSPWNPSKVVLVVSGNNDDGVIKAAQAISSGALKTAGGSHPNVALVADVRASTTISETVPPDTQTFEDLGYETITKKENGEYYLEYTFIIPPGYMASDEPYVEIVFTHSAMLDYEQSGIGLQMNGQVIGGVRFSEETTSLHRTKVAIPRPTMRVGENNLVISMVLTSINECLPEDLQGVWGTVWNDSLLSVPLKPAEERVVLTTDLQQYSEPFSSNPTLARTAFVVPRNAPGVWKGAAQIAFHLGADTQGELIDALAVYGDDVPDDVYQHYDLLIIGRPSTLPIISTLASLLPIPFEAGTDVARTQGSRIIYRFPPDVSIGYVQLLNPPWDTHRMVLAVLGNNEQGVQFASNALTDPELNWQLKGNFAIINNEQITCGDTRRGGHPERIAASVIPTGTLSERPLTETILMNEEDYRKVIDNPSAPPKARWILPALGLSLVLMVLLGIGLGFTTWRRHRSKHAKLRR